MTELSHVNLHSPSTSNPIRVLHVLGGLNRGGAETMIMNIYRNIDRFKVQFDFVVHTTDKCDYEDEIHKLGGRIFRIPRYYGKNHLKYTKEWHRFLNEHPEHKIIHGHMRSTGSIYMSIAKRYGRKIIAHSHSTSSGSGLVAHIKDFLQFPIRYLADYLFACSNIAGSWLFGKKALHRENFFRVNNAINLNKFVYREDIAIHKRKEWGIENSFVIGHIGRFNESKNHELLIDIFQSIKSTEKKAKLLLVGAGELRESIEHKVKKLDLEGSVIFAGNQPEVQEMLLLMDVFVFPSIYEGLGIAAVEAQASGLPCIVSDRVPKEAQLTDLIEVVSLEEDVNTWGEKILSYAHGYKRKEMHHEIKKQGYDVIDSTQWLQNFYLQIDN